MDESILVHIKGQVNSPQQAVMRLIALVGSLLATQGCAVSTSSIYEATAPVIEILQNFCDQFGLSSAACKLSTGHKEVPKNKFLGQVLLFTNLPCQMLL